MACGWGVTLLVGVVALAEGVAGLLDAGGVLVVLGSSEQPTAAIMKSPMARIGTILCMKSSFEYEMCIEKVYGKEQEQCQSWYNSKKSFILMV